jgi:glycerate 2-kinase
MMLFKNYEQVIKNGRTPELQQKRRDILDILTAAVEAVNPYTAVSRGIKGKQFVFDAETIDLSNFEHIFLVGFGKASVGMGKAVCDFLPVTKGVIITNDVSAQKFSEFVDIFVGGHPLPTDGSIKGTERVMEIVKQCGENDLLIVVISGGGSSLLCKPRIQLKDIQKINDLLLRSRADIIDINTVRKHLSLIKGGQLLRDTKGVVVSLILSDIIGDPVEFIASGPTAPDSTTYADAVNVLKKYDLWDKAPRSVRRVLESGIKGQIPETPKKDDKLFDSVFNLIIANNEIACTTAMKKAQMLGYTPKLVTTRLTGEARNIGKELICQIRKEPPKTVLFYSGETTVNVTGKGKGGRNQELVLGCAEHIAATDIVVASLATDGIDGNSDAAGAIVDGWTLSRAMKKEQKPSCFLDENNSYQFFLDIGDLLMTGSTGTNVMDIQVVLQ